MQYISKHAIRYSKTSVTRGASFTVDGILLFQNGQFCSVAYHLVVRDVPLLIHA